MTTITNKTALDLSKYEEFGIDQRYTAYMISFENIHEDKCDDIESDYTQQGYKIFHTDMMRLDGHHFKYSLIVAKMGFTF